MYSMNAMCENEKVRGGGGGRRTMTIVGQRGRVSPSTVTFSVSSWQKKRSQFGLFGVVVSLTQCQRTNLGLDILSTIHAHTLSLSHAHTKNASLFLNEARRIIIMIIDRNK